MNRDKVFGLPRVRVIGYSCRPGEKDIKNALPKQGIMKFFSDCGAEGERRFLPK